MSERRPFTLYWSSLATFEDCPRKFLYSKGWWSIDQGHGLGRKVPPPVKKSEHHAILGISIQHAIEHFYNSELWRTLDPESLKRRLLELADEVFRIELSRKFVDWREAGDRDELEKTIREGIMGYMRTLKQHQLLGPYARAEVELLGYVNKDTPIGGRADTIIRRDDTGITILDGKNSKRYKDRKTGKYTVTYTDPDQLRWYALLFYLTYRKLVDRLGFVYYRYPYGMPILDNDGLSTGEIEPGVNWVDFTMDDLNGLATRAANAMESINAEKFDPRPSPPTCKFCEYETICPERQAQIESNRRGPKASADIGVDFGGTVKTFTMD